MTVRLDYGKRGITVEVPASADLTVVEPRHAPGVDDPGAAVTRALRGPIGSAPLRERVRPTDRVGIVFSDITSPT
ncbi:MAG: lactate racemase domain-containing protein, partial [Spirochaetota bacterium]